jgi:hypothetical protein
MIQALEAVVTGDADVQQRLILHLLITYVVCLTD